MIPDSVRRCAWCADRFLPERKNAVYCSKKCGDQRYYVRNRETRLESDRRRRGEAPPGAAAERARRWREANSERAAELNRRWREANSEQALERDRRYYRENSEARLEYARRYREANPEARAESNRRWREANPEIEAEHNRRRRARKEAATVEDFTAAEVFERDGWICQLCSEPVDRALRHPDPLSVSLDHIIPIVFGGEHSRANTQCTHLVCNLRKGARLPEEATA